MFISPRRRLSHRRSFGRPADGFTLIELLVVLGVVSTMLGLATLAVTSLKKASDVTKGSYDLAEALETARTYAVTNDTYTWVGFFEEDASTPGTAGTGSVVVSVVAEKDGVQGFNPNVSFNATTNYLDSSRLMQIGPLLRLANTHLAAFSDGSGTGSMFDTRPVVGKPAAAGSTDSFARIGDNCPHSSYSATQAQTLFPFQYPVGGTTGSLPAAQYTFRETIQFNPRGESRINSTYDMRPIVEVGLRPTHGGVIDLNSTNVVAIQLTGISGTVKAYRK